MTTTAPKAAAATGIMARAAVRSAATAQLAVTVRTAPIGGRRVPDGVPPGTPIAGLAVRVLTGGRLVRPASVRRLLRRRGPSACGRAVLTARAP